MAPAAPRSRFIESVNGLRMHVLEAGTPGHPCVLLLHGFPELSYSWRKVIPALAAAGFHVLAPDQRGYGLTTGWDGRYEGDLRSFRMLNIVEDASALLARQGIARAHVVGHDFGSPVAAYAALTRPDVFRSAVLMSAPFGGAPIGGRSGKVHEELAAMGRKHYQWYYSTREADDDMRPVRKACAPFCAPTITTRARTGRATSRFRSRAGSPPSWRRCRRTTSWSSTRAWPRRSRLTCPRALQAG